MFDHARRKVFQSLQTVQWLEHSVRACVRACVRAGGQERAHTTAAEVTEGVKAD